MPNKDFGVLILTHGRPDNQKTTKALRKHGYTGRIVYVIDDEDKTADEYRNLYGSDVIQFCKEEYAKQIDESDNFTDRRTITYARNAAYDIAAKLGWKYFVQMDDDYQNFVWKFNQAFEWNQTNILSFDAIVESIIKFLKRTTVSTIAFAQGGDFIGGGAGSLAKSINIAPKFKRKSMNTFFCVTDRRVQFISRMNEDVSTYTWRGSTGTLFFTINMCMVNQTETQTNPGGITELYKRYGTYVKSFYTVMRMPSSVKVSAMRSNNARIHHKVTWRNTVPAILDPRWKK